MKKLTLTQEQIKTILKEIAKKENGYLELLKLSLNSMMEAEREIYKEGVLDVSNGYRPRRILGDNGMQIVLDVPRTRRTNFYPVLLAILNNRESEARELASYSFYSTYINQNLPKFYRLKLVLFCSCFRVSNRLYAG